MPANPFSTRFTSPRKCRFVNRDGVDVQEMIVRLPVVGQIVGPHGSGKSTLAIQLGRLLMEQGKVTRVVSCTMRRSNASRFGCGAGVISAVRETEIASRNDGFGKQLSIMDGIESLNTVNRYSVLWHESRGRDLVLLTTHRPLFGIPIVCRVEPDVKLFVELAMQFQAECHTKLSEAEIVASLERNRGNYRTTLMELYDLWQEANRALLVGASA